MSWDEAFAYVDTVIEDECAAVGMKVGEISEAQLGLAIKLFRIARRDHDPLRIEVPTAAV